MFNFFDIWFYVSSVCFQGRLYSFRGSPSIIAGSFGMCYMLAPIVLGWILCDFNVSLFIDDNPFCFISVLLLLCALLLLVFNLYYKSKKRGFRIFVKYRKCIRHLWQIMTIWLFYMVVLIPLLWWLNNKLVLYITK